MGTYWWKKFERLRYNYNVFNIGKREVIRHLYSYKFIYDLAVRYALGPDEGVYGLGSDHEGLRLLGLILNPHVYCTLQMPVGHYQNY